MVSFLRSQGRLLLNKPCSFVFPRFSKMASNEAEFYTFDALDIDGNNVSMGKYRGNVVIVVNVATLSQGLRILAFPCNQFRNQEPGTNAEIKEAARNKFGLTFDFFSKVDVNGPDALPLFIYLQKTLKGTLTNSIKWNFTKFLIDRNGIPYKRYSPTTDPEDMTKDIEKLLSAS
ncbi:glutathione peroxidase [Echinococcus multilocularis]|uniref:Glutathione peroxidase n=1 Tax=Echinococcus multilocularis TaxID=6211 RepID=A0A068XW64_ECHMU|nr:glutathione peroxidase [Echinococcus multilocularis]